tara:strand:- start:44461 stop:45564 length:1104 start_codon:yes stop_codon:yes gene_type:complete
MRYLSPTLAASSTALLCCLPCLPAQQTDVTPVQDLPDQIASLFEVTGRSQQFLSAEALGLPGSGTLHLHELSLRYDGPSQSAAATPHTLASLTIRIGSSPRSTQQIGAVFADNLGKPLTTVFQQSNYTIPADLLTTPFAQPWGSSNGELHFPFTAPIDVYIPTGGTLVVEFEVHANPAHTPAGTNLDFAAATGPARVGTSIAAGLSCGYPSMNPVVLTDGDYDIGTSFTFSGQGFTANMPVATWATTLLTPPVLLNGSSCWSYLDLASGPMLSIAWTDANGNFGGDPPVPIPPAPPLCGSKLYLQSAGITQPSPMNAIGIETSNYRSIVIGCRSSQPPEGWYVSRPGSWSASIATVSRGGVLAMRFQ